MKDRGTYLLLTLFFAGLVGLWALDFARVPTRKERDRMNSRILHELLDTKPDALRKVEILGGEGGPLVFERRDGNTWQMTSPMDVAANPSMVETLAYNLKELSRRPDSAAIEGDDAKFGLSPPERTIKLWGVATDAPLASLDVGIVSLDRRYVRAGGSEAVEVVDARGLDLLRSPAVRWRDHELFRVPSFEVDALNLSAGGQDLKLKRSRDAWRVVEPVRLLANEAKVDGLIADLGSLRVLDDARFVANDVPNADLDRFGLKAPSLIISVDSGRVDRRRATQVLQVGKPVEGQDGQVYAKRGDQDDVVIVDRRVLKDLKPEPNNFRSPKVADISLPRVVRVGVEDGEGGTLEAVRRGNEWVVVAPSMARGDRQAIQDYLKALDQLQTSIYLGPQYLAESGLEKPSLTLKVWQARDPRDPASASTPADPKGDLAMVLRVGHRDVARKSIYARVEGDSTILALPDSANSFLPRNPLAFRDRQILAIDPDEVEQVRVSGSGRNYRLNAPVFRLDGQNLGLAPFGWWMVEPVSAPAETPSVARLLKLLANLRAETLVTEKPEALAKYGLDAPALTLTWSSLPPFSMVEKPKKVAPSNGTIDLEDHSLLIGSPLPDKPNVRYAKLSDRPLIFTLGQDAIVALDAEWRENRVMTFEPAHARQVQLEWPTEGRSLIAIEEPGKSGWTLSGAQDAPDFDLGQVDALIQLASSLKTPRYLQNQGDFPAGTGLDPARLAIRFEFDDGSPPRTLKVGAPAGRNQVFASIEPQSNGAIFLLPEAPFSALMKAPRRRDDLPDNVFAP